MPAAAEPSRVVPAEEILKKIELGQPVKYDNVTVVGHFNLAEVDLPRVNTISLLDSDSLFGFLAKFLSFDSDSIFVRYFFPMDPKKLVTSPITITNSIIEGDVNIRESILLNLTDFQGTRFEGPISIENSMLNRTAEFRDAQFNDIASFSGTQFNQTAIFHRAHFKLESFFNYAYFIEAEFDSCQFSKEAFFLGTQIKGPLSLYRTKYDTLNIRWSSIHDLAYDDTAYYLLIQNFNKLGFYDDARECEYSYRCKHREELFRQHKFDRWLFDLLAWASYGYGLRPVRPLGWSALFILMGGLFFFLTGSVVRSKASPSGKKPLALRRKEEKPEGKVSFYETLLLSATYFTSGASSIISATPTEFVPLGLGRYVVVILRLLGWIFFVLFLSSLTRTV